MCSKFNDSKFGKITDMSSRFSKDKEGPGPCSYRETDTFSPGGKYVLSSHRSRGSRPFNRAVRKHLIDEEKKKNVPGPGTYEKPSDFGVYGDAKYYNTLNASKS